ncbi:MAG: MFS transporter [Acidobacteriota bacterium]
MKNIEQNYEHGDKKNEEWTVKSKQRKIMELKVNGSPERMANRWLSITFSSLRIRDYRIYWIGQLISLTGSWMQSVALGWLVLILTNSPFYLGLAGFAGSIPVLFFSLFGGVLADRFSKRNLLITTQTFAMVQAFILAGLTISKAVNVWHILFLATFLGTVNAIDAPTRQSFIAEIVSKEYLTNAIALNSTMFNSARIIGPALAGILMAVIGISGIFIINGISFLAVIWSLFLINSVKINSNNSHDSIWENLKEGFKYVKNNRLIISIIILVASFSVFGTSYMMLMPVFARDILQVGASGLGFLMAFSGIGALIGALSLASLGDYKKKGLLLTAGNLVLPITLFFFAISKSFTISSIFIFGVGWSMITQMASANSLIQSIVPDNLRGRVMSLYTLTFFGMMPIGSIQAGIIAELIGAPLTVCLGAILCAIVAAGILVYVPELRSHE